MIRDFIIEHFKRKLKDRQTLVVYDPHERYKELLPAIEDEQTKVFDISENLLFIREYAVEYYTNTLPHHSRARMLVYVPLKEPLSRQEKLLDPFYIFSFGGSVFPGDAADRYESLCKACFPDKEQKINELFADGAPDFDTLDALGGGNTWAKLQTLTGGKSEKEILLTLLAPSAKQLDGLSKDKSWYKEYKDLAQVIGLKTKEKNFDAISDELWRFMLYSEFVFDLPISLPAALEKIPLAKKSSENLVMEVCRALRNNKNCEDLYIEKADEVATQLHLPELFKNERELGEIITFAFEDNTYFYHFVDLLKRGKNEEAREIILRIKENIWLHHDEERRRFWKMAELGLQLLNVSAVEFKSVNSLKAAIEQYTTTGYKVDQFQRRFEKLAIEVFDENDALSDLKNLIRSRYREYAEKYQKQFQSLVKKEHWPLEGMLHNVQVFAKQVQPLLKTKTKTAYILVDALRYELAKELADNIEKYFSVQLLSSCAYLPTVTKFGMAAFLPNAEKDLSLKDYNGNLEAFMGEKPLPTLTQRREYLKEKLGTLCEIVSVGQLLSSSVPEADLLVVTTNEIDNAGENMAGNALTAMQQAIQNLIRALNVLKQKGYNKIVIATDHGFVLHPNFQAGDNVSKPTGEWLLSKSRCLAGSGATPDFALCFKPEEIGVRSNINSFVFVKNYAVFEKNTTYFHEGISLQETVLPVMILTGQKSKKEKKIQVNLTYKGKTSGLITTRRPMMEITSFSEELALEPISIRMEAISGEQVVGKPGSGEHVSEVSNLLEIIPGQAYKIALEMDSDFEGSFEVRLSDPVTNMTYTSITLETDYIS